jgi:hypothetical protein
MRLDLAERLRCPAPHEPTPLIVVAARVVDRELMEGAVGCPVCHLEARVTGGVVHFGAPHDITVAGDGSAEGVGGGHDDGRARSAPDDGAIDRTGALLDLAEPGGAVLLTGRYAAMASALRSAFGVATVVVRSRGEVPFTDHTFRAAALDPGAAAHEVAPDAIRTVAIGGRILLPAACHLPPAVRQLAADERERLGVREPPARVVPLTRAHPPRTTSR